MKIQFEDVFSVEKCRENPNKLYVFGDNWETVGKGGQAIIRDEPNTFGISTKYSTMESFSDSRMIDNITSIKIETDVLLDIAHNFEAIVFPKRGLGTGLAALQAVAPRTFIYLCQVMLDKFNFNNMAYLVPLN